MLALLLAAPLAVANARPETGAMGQSSSDEAGLIKVPPNATLLGKSVVDEIRAFPEMSKSGKSKPMAEKIVGIEGVDRVFSVDRSFADTVSYFDQQFKQGGFQQLARVETPSATAWTLKRPDGTVANTVVRNTQPTTVEIAEASATAAKVEPQR
jgi:hypothetical protein